MKESSAKKDDLIPKGLLMLLGSMVLSCLFLVFFSVLTDRPMVGVPITSEIQRDLSFTIVKMDDGSVSIFDKANNQLLNSYDGQSGFISVILIGLEYNRNKIGANLSSSYPVTLYKYKTGRISIEDVSTGWSMNVTSFGSKNANIFVKMFEKT